MRTAFVALIRLGMLVMLASAASAVAEAADVVASLPSALSVTIYRAPNSDAESIAREEGGYDGFALITETRDVTIPAGLNRLRFEGVAEGIEADTALLTGLPADIIEKNRDTRRLSSSSLLMGAIGKQVTLRRTNPKTGKIMLSPVRIRSVEGNDVVFETADGIETLQCSDLPETFTFEAADTGLAARPTLSVLTRSDRPVQAVVTLSYLAQNFDWAANYVATLAPDGRTLDLGAWITLANGNSVGFPDSQAQIVAGKFNHEPDQDDLEQDGPQGLVPRRKLPLGQCVPPAPPSAFSGADGGSYAPEMIIVSPAGVVNNVPPGRRTRVPPSVQQEQLGDLKLYRILEPTTIASLQVKQVRLLDKFAVPVERVYTAALSANVAGGIVPARLVLRTQNDAAHHLGLPLPSGRVAAYQTSGTHTLLFGEAKLDDKAVDEEVEFRFGDNPDIELRQAFRQVQVEPAPSAPGAGGRPMLAEENVVDIANAGREDAALELEIQLYDGQEIVDADHEMTKKNGHPLFVLTLPARSRVELHYRTGYRRP